MVTYIFKRPYARGFSHNSESIIRVDIYLMSNAYLWAYHGSPDLHDVFIKNCSTHDTAALDLAEKQKWTVLRVLSE